ncbi:unnamed protein product [Pleuronectes platessa]|uniref:Uncharacterized protein n=1 Tax=Pleuronectes platessa TaxID=8262 RepID=A0A9N7TNH0_PLEPL|nr:unnamed protein product [Pleuronectes platessa]
MMCGDDDMRSRMMCGDDVRRRMMCTAGRCVLQDDVCCRVLKGFSFTTFHTRGVILRRTCGACAAHFILRRTCGALHPAAHILLRRTSSSGAHISAHHLAAHFILRLATQFILRCTSSAHFVLRRTSSCGAHRPAAHIILRAHQRRRAVHRSLSVKTDEM